MPSVNVQFGGITDVKDFVNVINRFNGDFDLVSGRYKIDAKSIMGIFSLDLAKPLTLEIHDKTEADEVKEKLSKFIV